MPSDSGDAQDFVPVAPIPARTTLMLKGSRRTPSFYGSGVLKFENITFVAGKGKKSKTIIENVSAQVTDGREFLL
jgi:hypothetical protein